MSFLDDRAVKYALFTNATAADNEVVAAVTGKRIILVGYTLVSTGTNILTWKSDTSALSGPMAVAANAIIVVPETARGLMTTVAGEALNLAMGSATQVSGHIVYAEV